MWSANKRLAADWRDTGHVDGVGMGRELLAGVRRDHLLGLVWSDGREHGSPAHPDWRLEANPAALPAFKADAAS